MGDNDGEGRQPMATGNGRWRRAAADGDKRWPMATGGGRWRRATAPSDKQRAPNHKQKAPGDSRGRQATSNSNSNGKRRQRQQKALDGERWRRTTPGDAGQWRQATGDRQTVPSDKQTAPDDEEKAPGESGGHRATGDADARWRQRRAIATGNAGRQKAANGNV
ncbi:MAG: hypothetical protein M1826_004575 [Phylliscum demangeonii]|nr:MAG: hypothetical protein M1826_004575 [Phylliscum demangeonii]